MGSPRTRQEWSGFTEAFPGVADAQAAATEELRQRANQTGGSRGGLSADCIEPGLLPSSRIGVSSRAVAPARARAWCSPRSAKVRHIPVRTRL